MTIVIILLTGTFAIMAAVALARGLLAFHRDGERMRSGDEDALMSFGQQQNRMMFQRVLFQGVAVLLIALLGAFAAQAKP
jgi:Hypoxia induced protein conserved region